MHINYNNLHNNINGGDFIMKIIKVVTVLAAAYITVCLVLFPQECITAVSNALALCGSAVIPTLFPFFVCSSLFVSLGLAEYASKYLGPIMQPLFKTNGAGAVAAVLGIISGYPVGAKCAADLYSQNKLNKTEAERLIAFCNNSGPMFIMGTIGVVVYNSIKIGVILYVIHIASSFLTGVIYARLYKGEAAVCVLNRPSDTVGENANVFDIIGKAVGGAVNTILKVCGFVVFFAVISATLPQFLGREFVYAFFEITGGIKDLSCLALDPYLKLSFVSMFLALSGISVLLQVGAIIAEYNLSIRSYISGKVIQAVVSFLLTYLLFLMLKFKGCAEALFDGGYTGAFSMGGADSWLWHMTGAAEACGWCAVIIFAAVILVRVFYAKTVKTK